MGCGCRAKQTTGGGTKQPSSDLAQVGGVPVCASGRTLRALEGAVTPAAGARRRAGSRGVRPGGHSVPIHVEHAHPGCLRRGFRDGLAHEAATASLRFPSEMFWRWSSGRLQGRTEAGRSNLHQMSAAGTVPVCASGRTLRRAKGACYPGGRLVGVGHFPQGTPGVTPRRSTWNMATPDA